MLVTLILSLLFLVISLLVIWFFVSHDKGPKEPIGALWVAFGFGVLALTMSGIIEGFVINDSWDSSADLRIILVTSLTVGLIEEVLKFLPLALFIFKKRYFDEYNDGIIYFAICGLTFGFIENICYTLFFGTEVGIMRLLIVPIFHGATTAMVGYSLSRNKIKNKPPISTVLLLCLAVFIHGFYNFGMSSGELIYILGSIGLIIFLTTILFVLYARSNRNDRIAGISGSGFNNYCSACGYKNVNKSLFCENCGKKFTKL